MTDLKAALEGIGYEFTANRGVSGQLDPNPTFIAPSGIDSPHDNFNRGYASDLDCERWALGHAYANREALMNAIIKDLCFASALPIQLFTNYAGIEGWSDPVGGDEPCDALWNLWVKHHGLEAHMEAI